MPDEPASPDRLRVTGAMLSDRGYVREANEDCVAFWIAPDGDPMPERRLLALVADGMGGHAAGEVASGIAADTVQRLYTGTQGAPDEVLRACLAAANAAILARSRADPECEGMGTTCTVLALSGEELYLAHIGDSRAYLLHDGALYQISEDHSLVAEMVRDGTLAPEEAAVSLHRHIITRALGLEEAIDPFILRDRLAAGDRFVLCSDGLTDVVEPETIREIVAAMPPAEACRALVDAALAGGGPDNISVGVFAVDRRSAGR